MLIAIIETGAPPPLLAKRYGAYPAMMERMLAPHSPHFSFARARVDNGGALPFIGEIDGALITGSSAGVYEDHAWIAPLEDFIRRVAVARKPQVGICFGHQIMARAFGGSVAKSDKGWGVGVHDYEIVGEADWMRPGASRVSSIASHQDQVIEPPPGAKRLAASSFCPNAVLGYADGPAVSFQMHPEFEREFAADLLRSRKGRLPKPIVDDGLASLKKSTDQAILARWIANYFLSN